MVAEVKLKGCVAGAGVFCLIIGEFSHRKEPSPVFPLEVDESMEVSFHCAVLPLGLAVSLRVEGCAKFPFDSEEVTKR